LSLANIFVYFNCSVGEAFSISCSFT
jgi:hypothetical protein